MSLSKMEEGMSQSHGICPILMCAEYISEAPRLILRPLSQFTWVFTHIQSYVSSKGPQNVSDRISPGQSPY